MNKKLVAYITSGLPDINFTVDLAHTLKESGADILELGIPFSDPVADGPIVEEANLKVLKDGLRVDDILNISKQISPVIDTMWMGYFNSFYQRGGFESFMDIAVSCGVNGFLIPDLPHEESLQYKSYANSKDIALIDFVAPTDSDSRIKSLVQDSKKFIYLVAYAGITGSNKKEDLGETISSIRKYSNTDIYTGFGVNEKTAKEKSQNVDGVIVGSAFVEILLDDSISNKEKIERISNLARIIKEEIN